MRLGVARAGQGHLAAAGSRPQVAVALAGFGKAIGQGADGAGGDAALLPPPGGAQQRGDSVLLQRSGGGKGVAGQAEYQLAAQRCRQHGAAGLLGYPLHHKLCTQLFQHKGQIILLPYGDAAAGDDGIAAGQQLLHFTGDDLRVVGALLPFHGKAQLTQPGGVLDAVGIVNFTGCPRCAGCQQLAAGGKDAHGQRSADGYFGVALPCQHAQMGGGEHRPGRRDDRTGGYIFPPEHYVLQRFYGSIELYGLFAAVGQFLHQNAVRALRQRGAGHDAGSAPCGQRRSRGIARVKLHHHRQGDRGLPACTGSIRAVQGVAVQRAAVKGGLVHPGAEVGGSNAPAGGFQRDGLWGRRRQKRCRVQHAAQRLDGGAERLVHYNFLHRPAALPFCYGSDRDTGGGILFSKKAGEKEAETS